MNVTLPAELESYVRRKMRSNGYRSELDVVRDALRLMQEEDEAKADPDWPRKNERRIELIYKSAETELAAEEAAELEHLQQEADEKLRHSLRPCLDELHDWERRLQPPADNREAGA